MTYTANPATNLQPDTGAGPLDEAELDHCIAERCAADIDTKTATYARCVGNCNSGRKLCTSPDACFREDAEADWLDELLAVGQRWATFALAAALLAFLIGVLRAATANI